MSYWWLSYGKFAPEPDGLYPQARQVVTHYRERAGLSREQLAPRLGIGAKELYYAEHEGRGLNAITRRRQLCAILHIPPALLGLCEAPEGENWWVADYQPWPAEADGWPHAGLVMKFYRRAKK